jgi:O-antigen/teichoic acid export membrane protein
MFRASVCSAWNWVRASDVAERRELNDGAETPRGVSLIRVIRSTTIGMAETRTSARLVTNSAFNASAFVVAAALNILVIPFVIHHLGVATFGIAGLVTACIAPAMIFSTPLGLSAAREFAMRLTADRQGEARRLFASALFLACSVGGLIAIGLAIGGPVLARAAFNLDQRDLGLAFAFGVFGWFCQCCSAVLISLLTARQDYGSIASLNIGGTAVAAAATFVLVPMLPQASTYLACQALGAVATLGGAFVIAHRLSGGWLSAPAFHRGEARDLARFGSWQLVAQGGGMIATQADRYLLGALLPPEYVGFYVVAQRLEEAIYIGVLKVGEILFPFFSMLQKEAKEHRVDLLLRSSWMLNLLAASALGAIVPAAGPILDLWTGPRVAAEAELVLVTLSVAGILGCGSNAFMFYLLAEGRSRANAIISFVTAAFTLLTSALVLPAFGWRAAGWSACIGMLAQIVTVFSLLAKAFDQPGGWARVFHFVVQPLLTGIVVALLLRHAVRVLFPASALPWWAVAALYGAAALLIFATVVAVSLLGPYGKTCARDLQSVWRRLSSLRVR